MDCRGACFFALGVPTHALAGGGQGNCVIGCGISDVRRLGESRPHNERDAADQGDGHVVDVSPGMELDNEAINNGATCDTQVQ